MEESGQRNDSLVDRRWGCFLSGLLKSLPVTHITRNDLSGIKVIAIDAIAPTDEMLHATSIGGDGVVAFAQPLQFCYPGIQDRIRGAIHAYSEPRKYYVARIW